MSSISRREFLSIAAAIGATAAFGRPPLRTRRRWRERRDLYPEGVASGDPRADGMILWTRHPGTDRAIPLTVEVSEDREFTRVVASARAVAAPEADWTVRVLVGGLAPAREYWYRFTDGEGNGSRVGRTITAPDENDDRPVRFTFVSCQDVTTGALNAYRRMMYEDERAPADQRFAFVLHLGDFIYEVIWYPEDRPQGYFDRTIREVVRYPHGEKVRDLHIPTDVDDYRAVYRAYLHDPDLQDARARWPFVCMWDNHEFSWRGWQSFLNVGAGNVPAQTRKVAANQAWWEYQPSRVAKPSPSLDAFAPPTVSDAPIARFDEHGLGQESNNLLALGSLTAYRALRFGKHLDLILTDQHSYRSEEPSSRPEAAGLSSSDFLGLMPQEAMELLDAGSAANGGHPPETISSGSITVPNFRRHEPPQTILGATQKTWLLERLARSRATWKVWGNSQAILDLRADPQHLPAGLTNRWPGAGYACFGGGDPSSAYVERAEIFDFVTRRGITGLASVSGDRHSFWAGLMAKALPPARFDPVGVAFTTGSISSASPLEAYEYRVPKGHPLRPLFLADRPGSPRPHATINMLLKHGVRSCLEYTATGDLARARALRDPDNAPHLAFVDMGGHGYAALRVSAKEIECEFVCIPRPIQRSESADGGPLRYRVMHRAPLWSAGTRPELDHRVLEGDPELSL